MTRMVFWTLAALAVSLPSAAGAESYRAGPLGAWNQNGDFSCEGGEALLFEGGDFAIVPHENDDRTAAFIDSRKGRAKTGGSDVAAELDALRDDPAVCAGPIDCGDWATLSAAMEQCWQDEPVPTASR